MVIKINMEVKNRVDKVKNRTANHVQNILSDARRYFNFEILGEVKTGKFCRQTCLTSSEL